MKLLHPFVKIAQWQQQGAEAKYSSCRHMPGIKEYIFPFPNPKAVSCSKESLVNTHRSSINPP